MFSSKTFPSAIFTQSLVLVLSTAESVFSLKFCHYYSFDDTIFATRSTQQQFFLWTDYANRSENVMNGITTGTVDQTGPELTQAEKKF